MKKNTLSMYPSPSSGIMNRFYTDLYMGSRELRPGPHPRTADIPHPEQPSNIQGTGKSHTTTIRPSILIK